MGYTITHKAPKLNYWRVHVMEINKELIQQMPEGHPQIEVTKSIGFTVNLQGYESARIDATVKVTGLLENKEEIKKLVTAELESEIQNQIGELVKQHDPNKTLLGYRK
jgi:hypothetical protein